MEMYVIITLVAIGLFILADVYRLHRKARKELARRKRRMPSYNKVVKRQKEETMKKAKPKPNIIRVNGTKPISLPNDTPLVWGASASFVREEMGAE